MISYLIDRQTQQKAGESLLIRSQIPVHSPDSERLNPWQQKLGRVSHWVRLNFTMSEQQQTNWCWSAVATSTSLYYNPSSTWTQSSLVNAELSQTNCCQSGDSSACNQPWSLNSALKRTGNLVSFTQKVALSHSYVL